MSYQVTYHTDTQNTITETDVIRKTYYRGIYYITCVRQQTIFMPKSKFYPVTTHKSYFTHGDVYEWCGRWVIPRNVFFWHRIGRMEMCVERPVPEPTEIKHNKRTYVTAPF